LLIVKLVAFSAILLIAAWSRRLVHGPGMGIFAKPASEPASVAAAAAPRDEVLEEGGVATLVRADTATVATVAAGHQSRLKRSVRGELVFGAVVLAITAMLVNTSPPRSAASAGPVEVSLKAGKVDLGVHFGPSTFVGGVHVGQPNVLHVTVTTPAGRPRDLVDAKASLSNPGQNVAPIPIRLSHENTGFYAGSNIVVPFPGTWTLTITVFLTDVDASTASTPVTAG
jgi:copper transport protein